MRCSNDVTLDALVGRLIPFEQDNFDNYSPNPSNFESSFKAKLTLGRKDVNSKGKQIDSDDDDESDKDLEIIEALLAKRDTKGKGKYKGRVPLILLSC